MSDGQAMRRRFGLRIAALADRSGLSVEVLAARATLSVQRIKDIMGATSDCVTLREMTLLSNILITPVADLLAPSDPVGIVPFEKVEQGGARHA